MDSMMRETFQDIDLKSQKKRIVATIPPTDTLHRATLINPVLVPLHNHVLMALQHKIKTFVQAFSQQIYHNKYVWPRTNLAMLANQDTKLSRRYRLNVQGTFGRIYRSGSSISDQD
jgi:hypothetical protein